MMPCVREEGRCEISMTPIDSDPRHRYSTIKREVNEDTHSVVERRCNGRGS